MREQILFNQGAVTVEFHTQLRNDLSNSKEGNSTRNHPLIHETLIISVMNVIFRKVKKDPCNLTEQVTHLKG